MFAGGAGGGSAIHTFSGSGSGAVKTFSGPPMGTLKTFSGPTTGNRMHTFSGQPATGNLYNRFSGSPRILQGIGPRAPSNLIQGNELQHKGIGEHQNFVEHHGHHHADHRDFYHHGFPWWWAWGGPGWGYWNYPGYADYWYSGPYAYGVASVPYDSAPTPEASTIISGGTADSDFFSQGVMAFRTGNYQEALRLAGHAAIDMRGDARPHELASLALFALGNFQGAAMESHAALAMGQPADWATLYSYYNDLPTYQRQLDALNNYVAQRGDSADAKFLLAYHNLMMGHRDLAKTQLAEVVKMAPNDQLAARLLESIGGKAATPPVPEK
jgi:hypothetical protein